MGNTTGNEQEHTVTDDNNTRPLQRIDAHHHLWDLDVRDQPWTAELPALRRSFAMDDLGPLLARNQIDATVLVQTVTVAEETPEMLQLAATDPYIAGVVGWVDLTANDVDDRLTELRSGVGGDRLVGIRHQVQGEPDPAWLSRSDVIAGLGRVADADLVYDLLVIPEQLDASIDAAQRVDNLTFVLDHAAKPLIASGVMEPWASQIRRLAACPNVYAKMSGLVTEAGEGWTSDQLKPYTDVLLEAFGPDRVMFGSDWPVLNLVATYDEVVAATEAAISGLSSAEQQRVFGGSAVEAYGLAR